MDDFRRAIMQTCYGGCGCRSCLGRVDKKLTRRVARARAKAQLVRDLRYVDTALPDGWNFDIPWGEICDDSRDDWVDWLDGWVD